MKNLIFLCFFLITTNVYSALLDGKWSVDMTLDSSGIADRGGELLGSSGLSWPDGRQAIITFWRLESGAIARCIDYFQSDMQFSGASCQRP
jgi:hypothetical protein